MRIIHSKRVAMELIWETMTDEIYRLKNSTSKDDSLSIWREGRIAGLETALYFLGDKTIIKKRETEK